MLASSVCIITNHTSSCFLPTGWRQQGGAYLGWLHCAEEVLPCWPGSHDWWLWWREGSYCSWEQRLLSEGEVKYKLQHHAQTSKPGHTSTNTPSFSPLWGPFPHKNSIFNLHRHTRRREPWLAFCFPDLQFKRPVVKLFSSPVLRLGTIGVPGAGSDQLRLKDPPQQELYHALHTLLHEKGGHAGSRPTEPVWRRAL